MPHLVFLYNFICYSFSFAAYLFAIVTASVKKPEHEWRYVLFGGAFLLLFLPNLISSYLDAAEVVPPDIVTRLLCLSTILGLGLLIYSIPVFVRSTLGLETRRLIKLVFIVMAAIPAVGSLVFLETPAERPFRYLLYACLILSIGYATVFGNLTALRMRSKDGEYNKHSRWGRIFKGVSIATVIFIPLTVLFDMYPAALPFNLPFLSYGFMVYPLYYLVWNILYTVNTLPLYIHTGSDVPSDGSDAGLSKREIEIAELLIDGLSYKAIADHLNISLSTVKTHIMRIYRKTGSANKIELLKALSPTNPA